MKILNKKMLTSTILASLVLGAVGTLHNHAFADTSSVSSSSDVSASNGMKSDPSGHGPGGSMGSRGGDIFKETAALLSIEQSTLMESLQAGQTLVQIAAAHGLTEDEYLVKLTAAITASMNAEVTAGTMTQEQVDQQTTGLSERLKKQIESKASGQPPQGSDSTNGKPSGEPGDKSQNSGSTAADTSSDNSLIDIDNHWASTYIKHLVKKGILQGDDNKRFNPDTTVTREELASMVTRSFNLETSSSNETTFLDVPQSRWSFKNIDAAKDYFDAQTDASGKSSFKPTEGAQRQDVAVTLVKVLLKQNASVSLLDTAAADKLLKEQFKDAESIPVSLRTYVATAVKNGFIQGDDQGNFAPQKTITRAEVATLLDRLLSSGTETAN